MEKANNFHSKIKFTAEMSETAEITFLDTKVYKSANTLQTNRNLPEQELLLV